MPLLFVSVIFIASCVYLPVCADLRALEANYLCYYFCVEHLKNKTRGKIRLYSMFLRFAHYRHMGAGALRWYNRTVQIFKFCEKKIFENVFFNSML